MRKTLGLAALAAVLACGGANAQQVNVKIGVLSDMSSLYADIGGPGSVAAAKLAIADFTKDHPNVKVEMITGDHQNKPDIGSQIANQWYDVDKVDMIIDMPNSGVALAVEPGHCRQEQDIHRLWRSGVRPHRREVQRQHHALDLRHLDARQRHRHGNGEDGRRYAGFSSPPTMPSVMRSRRDTMAAVEKAGGKVARQGAPPA